MIKGDEEKNDSTVSPEKSQHTPTPWRVGGLDDDLWIYGRGRNATAICDLIPRDADSLTLEDKANAEFIVRAVNTHDALIVAAKKAILWFAENETLGVTRELIAALKLTQGSAPEQGADSICQTLDGQASLP